MVVYRLLFVQALSCVSAFPGPAHLHPAIHFAPSHVSEHGGWHDIAGALTHQGVHHVYMGQGWNHHWSKDLVTWSLGEHGPQAIEETYAGMHSVSDPCSGFLTKDSDGTVCAGFRQCGSNKGVAGGNPWDVPLEVRCDTSAAGDMSAWSTEPDYLFNVSWYRPIPYDPARPWVESDGNVYVLLSMDGCNATTRKAPCSAGGELHLWRSPALRGPKAAWEHVGPVLTTNATVLKTGFLSKEFVTIDYIGKLKGDPSPDGSTRIFFNNVGGNGGGDGCCDGTTSYFTVKQDSPGAKMVEVAPQRMVDWGAFKLKSDPAKGETGTALLSGVASRGFSMARTLGTEEADQVTKPGRRVMIGWTGPSPFPELSGQGSAQSIPRELSLAADGSLAQAFVPEMEALRCNHSRLLSSSGLKDVFAGMQAEVVATFFTTMGLDIPEDLPEFGFSVLGDGNASTTITLSPATGLVRVDARAQGNVDVRAGPLPPPISREVAGSEAYWHVHAIVDHSILEVIVNNNTALVVYMVPSEAAGLVSLSGSAMGSNASVVGELDIWSLAAANHSNGTYTTNIII